MPPAYIVSCTFIAKRREIIIESVRNFSRPLYARGGDLGNNSDVAVKPARARGNISIGARARNVAPKDTRERKVSLALAPTEATRGLVYGAYYFTLRGMNERGTCAHSRNTYTSELAVYIFRANSARASLYAGFARCKVGFFSFRGFVGVRTSRLLSR